MARLNIVRKDYQDLLQRYPDFARGHLAYASFLNNLNDEKGAAMLENEKARQLDPKNPAAWNNLAHLLRRARSNDKRLSRILAKPLNWTPTNRFIIKISALSFMFTAEMPMAFYHLNEQQVFDKALALYQKAIQLDPDNFPLATDYAENYYGIRPLRTNDALAAWTNALHTAHNEAEREGVYIHLARIKIVAGRFDEARAQLDAVTNSIYAGLKDRGERNLAEREYAATNPAAAGISTNIPNSSTTNFTAPPHVPTTASNAIPGKARPPLILTNGVPALPNPPVFSPKIVTPLTNVPPAPPKASNLSRP